MASTRKKPTKDAETEVLVRSRRRCALCFGLRGDLQEKRGQLAHVDRNPGNSDADNLCFLCLEHHDQYDSSTSQSKAITVHEVRHYRDALYADLDKFGIRPEQRIPSRSVEVVFLSLYGNSVTAGRIELELKNEGTAFTILEFEVATPGAKIRQWHPRSLSPGEFLRAPTDLPYGQPTEMIFHLKIRDRSGAERAFQISVDTRPSPPAYDFVEIGYSHLDLPLSGSR